MHVGCCFKGITDVNLRRLSVTPFPRALLPKESARLYSLRHPLARLSRESPIHSRCSSLRSARATTKPPLSHFRRPTFIHTLPPSMERNGEARNKRKQSPITIFDRPAKQLKPEISDLSNGDETPQSGFLNGIDSEGEDSRLVPLAPATADTPEWQATIEKVVRNVVSIHFCQPCSFDTDSATSSEATGNSYSLTTRLQSVQFF